MSRKTFNNLFVSDMDLTAIKGKNLIKNKRLYLVVDVDNTTNNRLTNDIYVLVNNQMLHVGKYTSRAGGTSRAFENYISFIYDLSHHLGTKLEIGNRESKYYVGQNYIQL